MSYSIQFTDNAIAEIIKSSNWYEEQQDGLSDRFILEIEGKISLISDKPEIYPKSVGRKQEAVLQTFPFVILFRVVKSQNIIFILSVFHTSRNPKQKFRKKF